MFSRQKIRKYEDKLGIWFSKIFYHIASPFINKDKLLIKGFYRKTKEVIEEYNLKYTQIYPRTHAKLAAPKTNDNIPLKFRATEINFPEEIVVEIPDARVFGKEGLVILPDNKCILDVNIMGNEYKSLKQLIAKDPYIIEGNSLFLCTTWSNFYYHWMIDVLPKVHLWEKSGVKVDNFVVNELIHNFQKESLNKVGIPLEKIIQTDKKANLKFNNLVVPSQPGYMGVPPEWACNFLRSSLSDKIPLSDPLNIYISRRKAFQRKILNEEEVIEFLYSRGFKKIYPEEYSLSEQIKLFKSAQTIVAPHGGGLTNIVFSTPGTKIIEIFSPTFVNPCYWRLANALNLDYYYVLGEENIENHNIILDINKLKDIL